MEITFTISSSGNHSMEDLESFVRFSLGVGSCSQDNPFIAEKGEAEIVDVYVD